jgi:hypothetical protein
VRLFADAVEAYRAALEVRTRDGAPSDWMMSQSALATALLEQADASTDESKIMLLRDATKTMRATLSDSGAALEPDSVARRERWIESVEEEIRKLEGH